MSVDLEKWKRFEIPGRVVLSEGNGGLTKVLMHSDSASAEIYLHGAHVAGFQKNGEAPILFMSASSRFEEGQPIRGGIPVIFPWFGAREDGPLHGLVRLSPWHLLESAALADGGVRVRLGFPTDSVPGQWPSHEVSYEVTLTDRLTLELTVTNTSADKSFEFENCLHTYFAVGDVSGVSIQGLEGVSYIDRLDSSGLKIEKDEAIRIGSEVDRIYINSKEVVEIVDPMLGRRIRVEKSGSASTVVWNPWINKSRQLQDFGDEEYGKMVCVESGNVGPNKLSLQPGATSALSVTLSSRRME